MPKNIVPVTKERLKRRDHYRAQVNVKDKIIWAVGYGLLVKKGGPAYAESLRNAFADRIEDLIKAEMIREFANGLSYDWLRLTLEELCPEEEVRDAAWAWLDRDILKKKR